jgi:hypothetical protein
LPDIQLIQKPDIRWIFGQPDIRCITNPDRIKYCTVMGYGTLHSDPEFWTVRWQLGSYLSFMFLSLSKSQILVQNWRNLSVLGIRILHHSRYGNLVV